MTYGDTGGQIRAGLTTLLRQHRIQQRLGGAGSHTMPVTTTAEQRRVMGEQIQRYRWAALMWCLQAVSAVGPKAESEIRTGPRRRPAEELRYRLTSSLNAMEFGLPLFDELTTPQPFAMVETWRQVAKAAVLGEHDFGDVAGPLSGGERAAVVRDAAEVTRALIVLDRRYGNIPGWQEIRHRGWLDRAARTITAAIEDPEPDYTVDLRGWRAPSALIEGGPRPGIGGVLQAQHNMLVHLSRPPNALNLRRIIDSQRVLSHEAARLAPLVAPELIDRWLEREGTYQQLVHETRNLRGLLGGGGLAAGEAANAVGRLDRVHVNELATPEPLQGLNKLFGRADARIAAVIEEGATARLYFVSVKVPRIGEEVDPLAHTVQETHVPVASGIDAHLLTVVRGHLLPPVTTVAPQSSGQSRQMLRESVAHRPPRRDALDR